MNHEHEIPQAQLVDHPDFAALVLNAMLFKLGGQITFPIVQLSELSHEYPKIRIAIQIPKTEDEYKNLMEASVTLTLMSARGESDKFQHA